MIFLKYYKTRLLFFLIELKLNYKIQYLFHHLYILKSYPNYEFQIMNKPKMDHYIF